MTPPPHPTHLYPTTNPQVAPVSFVPPSFLSSLLPSLPPSLPPSIPRPPPRSSDDAESMYSHLLHNVMAGSACISMSPSYGIERLTVSFCFQTSHGKNTATTKMAAWPKGQDGTQGQGQGVEGTPDGQATAKWNARARARSRGQGRGAYG